jgi:hypothetical protein
VKPAPTLHNADRGIRSTSTRRDSAPSFLARIGSQVRLLKLQGPVARSTILARKLLRAISSRCWRALNSSPRLRGFFITFIRNVGLYDSLASLHRRLAAAHEVATPPRRSPDDLDRAIEQLPPAVRQAYNDLTIAINQRERR